MTDAEVSDKLWEWLTATLGATVIYAFQGATEPSEPYIVMNLTLDGSVRAQPTARDVIETGAGDDAVITEAPVLEWFWRYSLNCYGEGGTSLLRRLRSAKHVPAAMDGLAPLSLFEVSNVRNVPELVNEEYQARAQVDVEVRGLVRDGAFVIDVAETAQPAVITKI